MTVARMFLLLFSFLGTASILDGAISAMQAQGVPTDVILNYPTEKAPDPAEAPAPASAPPPVIVNTPTTQQDSSATASPLTAKELKRLHDNQVRLTPPSPAPPPSASKITPSLSPGYSGNTFVPPPSATISRPIPVGGISLTRAAAERMPLNLSIEGALVENSRIVLSGHSSTEGSIDAALFLTALRATCEGRDPYFSLDPDDVSLWLKETEKGGKEFFQHIKNDTTWALQKRATRNSPSILNFRTISASQSYPAFWSSILAKYPHLKSRLVFGPEWMRQTRFGEILYKADVLLKELAGGVSMLGTPQLRASKIDDYLSATQISSAMRLLYKYHNLPDGKTSIAGGRIWYDLSETSDVVGERPESIPAVSSELRTLLQRRHLLRDNSPSAILPVSLQQSEGSLDISSVFPRMYVRVRDPITLRDGAGNFPGVNELVAGANGSPQKYAAAYKEYRALVEVFRAYVVAVHARRMEPRLCAKLPKGLLDAEKLSVVLPEYHPTDLTLTIGWYEYSDGRLRRAIGATGALFQGGVSVGATPLFSRIVANTSDTPVLRELKVESAKMHQEARWAGVSGRQFVAFNFDDVTASAPPVKFASVPLKEGEDFGPPVTPKEKNPSEQRSAQWEQRLGNKAAQVFPTVSSGPRREMNLQEVLVPASIALVLLVILVRLLAGPSPARANSGVSAAKAPQGAAVFAMPDLSSPNSIPYVPPWQKDRDWKTRAAQPASSSGAQGTVPSDSKSHSYDDAAERDFKNVFAIKSRVDKEQMIQHWKNVHGGSREDAMRRLVEQWRHDNRG